MHAAAIWDTFQALPCPHSTPARFHGCQYFTAPWLRPPTTCPWPNRGGGRGHASAQPASSHFQIGMPAGLQRCSCLGAWEKHSGSAQGARPTAPARECTPCNTHCRQGHGFRPGGASEKANAHLPTLKNGVKFSLAALAGGLLLRFLNGLEGLRANGMRQGVVKTVDRFFRPPRPP